MVDLACIVGASLAEAQRQAALVAEGKMRARVLIKRKVTPTFDYSTGALTDPDSTVYEGKASIGTLNAAQQMLLGEEVEFYSTASVEIPVNSPPPKIDDVLVVLAAPDPLLVGRRFRVLDVGGGGDLPTSITMTVVGISHSRTQAFA